MIDSILDSFWWIDKVAGAVWVLLTAILIWILLKLYRANGASSREFKVGSTLLIFVWLYPLYTGFFQFLVIAEIGNILTLVFTIVFYNMLKKKRKELSKWMIPQAVWLSIATIYLGIQLLY